MHHGAPDEPDVWEYLSYAYQARPARRSAASPPASAVRRTARVPSGAVHRLHGVTPAGTFAAV